MRYIAILILFLNSNLLSAQEDSFIVGEWKVVSVDDGDIYLNAKTNSFTVSNEMKEHYSNASELENMIDLAKEMYLNNKYSFKTNGVFNQTLAYSTLISGTYEVDNIHKTLNLTTTNSLGQDVTEKFPYLFTNNILKFSFPLEDNYIVLEFEKVKN